MPVFLSYSRENEETVKALTQGFQAAEREVWYDQDLRGGDAWWAEILDNIRLASVFIFALSDASLNSRLCRAELEYAFALKRPVVPVQVGSVGNLRGHRLSTLQILPFRSDDAVSAFKIIAAVDEASRHVVPLPDPLPAAPPVPFAYLLKLSQLIENKDLDSANQTAVVDQLRRALRDESDPSITREIVNILKNLISKPWCTRQTETEVKAILRTYAAASSASENPRPALARPAGPPAQPEKTVPAEAEREAWPDPPTGPEISQRSVFEQRMEELGHRLPVDPAAIEERAPVTPVAPTCPGVGTSLDQSPTALPPSSVPKSQQRQEPLTPDQKALQEPDHGSVIGLAADDNVQFTVYRPRAVRPGEAYPMLAFAHLADRRPGAAVDEPHPLERVRRLAEKSLGASARAYEGPRSDAAGPVPFASELTFVPAADGIEFQPAAHTFEWREDVHQASFTLIAQGHRAGQTTYGQMTVYLGAFILADVRLAFSIQLAAPAPPSGDPHRHRFDLSRSDMDVATGSRYRKVFPSYSHRDVQIVRQAETYGRALGDVYLRDRVMLRSGEEWDARLLQLIDEADVFQLFWSRNSMMSPYVRREWEYALSLNRPAFVRPTYWEWPMPKSDHPPLPPPDLSRLHFHGFNEVEGRSGGAPHGASSAPARADEDSGPRARSSPHRLGPPTLSARNLIIVLVLVLLVGLAAGIIW